MSSHYIPASRCFTVLAMLYSRFEIRDLPLAFCKFQERISKGPQGEHEEGFSEWLRQRDQQEMVPVLNSSAICSTHKHVERRAQCLTSYIRTSLCSYETGIIGLT